MRINHQLFCSVCLTFAAIHLAQANTPSGLQEKFPPPPPENFTPPTPELPSSRHSALDAASNLPPALGNFNLGTQLKRGIFYSFPDAEIKERAQEERSAQLRAKGHVFPKPPSVPPPSAWGGRPKQVMFDLNGVASKDLEDLHLTRPSGKIQVSADQLSRKIIKLQSNQNRGWKAAIQEERGYFQSPPLIVNPGFQVSCSVRIKGEAELMASEYNSSNEWLGTHRNRAYYAKDFEQIGYNFTASDQTAYIIIHIESRSDDALFIKNLRIHKE